MTQTNILNNKQDRISYLLGQMNPCVSANDIPSIVAYNKLSKNEKKEVQAISKSIADAINALKTEVTIVTNEELVTYVYDDRDPYLQISFNQIIREIEEETANEKVSYATYETQGEWISAGIQNFLALRGYSLRLHRLVSSRTDKCPEHYYFWPGVWNKQNPFLKKLARTQLLTLSWPLE